MTDREKRFRRAPQYDRRAQRGDDFSGDAWIENGTGVLVYGAVGVDRNRVKNNSALSADEPKEDR